MRAALRHGVFLSFCPLLLTGNAQAQCPESPVTTSAYIQGPIPNPPGDVRFYGYGPLHIFPPGALEHWNTPHPGATVTYNLNQGCPGCAYSFYAESVGYRTVFGGSLTCFTTGDGCGACSGSANLKLPPLWVEEPVRGVPPPDPPPGAPAPPNGCPPGSVGNPVDVITGNVWLDQTDATIPGRRVPLTLERSYNSALARSTPYRLAVGTTFGPGWTHTYERRIRHPDPGGTAMRTLVLRAGDGQPLYFEEDPLISGRYIGWIPNTEQSFILKTPTSYTRHFSDGRQETYDSLGRLTSLADAVGVTTTLAYDASSDRLLSVTDGNPPGRTLSFGYDGASTRATTLSGPLGLIATYAYDLGGRLESVSYADGDGDGQLDGKFTFTYETGSNNLASVKDRDNKIVEQHSYVPGSFKGTTSELADGVEKYTLEYWSDRTTVTDALGHVTRYDHRNFAGIGRVTRVIGPCAGCGGGQVSQTWDYDADGRLTTDTDGEGNVTRYTYHADGNLHTVRHEDSASFPNHETSYTYHPDGRLYTRTDPNGAVTTITYGPAGPETIIETINTTDQRLTQIVYAGGRPQYIIDPRGKEWELHFTSTGDLEWTEDPVGYRTHYTHDLMGRLTQVIPPPTTPAIQTPITSYDTLGRVKKVTNTDGSGSYTEFTYNGVGRRKSVRDAEGRVTDYGYDAYGRLETVTNRRTPPDADLVTRHGYDSMSNLTSITDARLKVTGFDYDSFNRLWRVRYPGTPTLTDEFSYDDAGRLSSRIDRKGVTTTFSYDFRDRLTRKHYSGVANPPSDVVFTYDEGSGIQHKGRLTSAANGPVTLAWTYDLLGQVLTESATRTSGPASTVGYEYDLAGNRIKLKLNDDDKLSYTYDDRGLPAMIRRLPLVGGDYVFSHDAASRRTMLTFPTAPPATQTAYGYDTRSRLSSVATSRSGSPIAAFTYPLYDQVDNRLARAGATGPTETYHYDDLYRLDWVKRGTPFTETYSYDPVGNRLTSMPFPTPPWGYDDRNELLSYGGDVALGYDDNGNLTSKSETSPSDDWTYEWDVENRLTRVTHNASQVATYSYDPLGRRNQRNLGTILYTYVYDGEDILFQDFTSIIMEENMIDPPPHFYVHGPGIDEPLAVEHGNGAIWYYHADGLGSIVRATDGNGNVTQPRQYDAFGRPEDGADQEGYAYTGREWDPETGLYYYRARYYDPKIGRFISEDPIELPRRIHRELNGYAYVGNNPINWIDPFGLEGQGWWETVTEWADHVWEYVAEGAAGATSGGGGAAAVGGGAAMAKGGAALAQGARTVWDTRRRQLCALNPKWCDSNCPPPRQGSYDPLNPPDPPCNCGSQ